MFQVISLLLYSPTSFLSFLRYVNAQKTLATCLRYHVIITTTNSVNTMSRHLEGIQGGTLEGEVLTD
jgi:hypothetical protein